MIVELLAEQKTFGVSKLKMRLHRLVRVYTCQNATSLEITCRVSYVFGTSVVLSAQKNKREFRILKASIVTPDLYQMSLVATKPVYRVSDKAIFKPVSSATETSWKIEISPVASLHMVLFKKRISKALIRLRGCAGWSAPLLFAHPRRQTFSRRGPNVVAWYSCQLTTSPGI